MTSVSSRRRCRSFLLISMTSLAAISSFSASNAAVAISSDPTQNMACAAGVCSPTASDAVLNASDLEAMLASGDLTVTTTGSGVQANDIDVEAGLSWSSAGSLSFDAYRSLAVAAPVSVQGQGGLSVTTNDGDTEGRLYFKKKGGVVFANLSSGLSINGRSFALVGSIAALASAVAGDPTGAFAFANGYDASQDGTYASSPVPTTFAGTFEGLGNVISNLTVDNTRGKRVGFFSEIRGATVRDICLTDVFVAGDKASYLGGLVADVEGGMIEQSCVSGGVGSNRKNGFVGGLAGYVARGRIDRSWSAAGAGGGVSGGLVGVVEAGGVVERSYATAYVSASKFTAAGGLVAGNAGTITECFATGNVSGREYNTLGGLVGVNSGAVSDSYAGGTTSSSDTEGGLVGENGDAGTVKRSYSFGVVTIGAAYAGGLIGSDSSNPGNLARTYWDRSTSGINSKSQGAGNIADDPGIRGKINKELKAGLPMGFSSKVWGENAKINGGLPYLLANPPPK